MHPSGERMRSLATLSNLTDKSVATSALRPLDQLYTRGGRTTMCTDTQI